MRPSKEFKTISEALTWNENIADNFGERNKLSSATETNEKFVKYVTNKSPDKEDPRWEYRLADGHPGSHKNKKEAGY